MKNFLKKLRNILCYCGVTKEEYRSIKKEAYVSNFHVWKYLHILVSITVAILFVMDAADPGSAGPGWIHLITSVYALIVAILFFYVFQPDSLAAQLIIYGTMILLLCCGLRAALAAPDSPSVIFIMLLVMQSVFMIDKPYFMAIVTASAVGVFIAHIYNAESGTVLRNDIIYSVVFGVIGIIINTFYNTIRIREFVLTREQIAHLQEKQSLDQQNSELHSILSAMTSDYDGLFLDNFLSGRSMFARTSGRFAEWAARSEDFQDYNERIRTFAETYVIPEDRADFIDKLSEFHLTNAVSEYGYFSHRFRITVDQGYRWMETRSIPYIDYDGRDCILTGIRNIDAKVQQEIQQQADRKNREMQEVINNLAEDFDSVYYVELQENKEDDRITIFRSSELLSSIISGWNYEKSFHSTLDLMYSSLVVPQDRDVFYSQTRREVILDHLSKSQAYFVNFRALINGTELYYQIKFSPVKNRFGNLSGFVVGIHNIDEKTRDQMRREAMLAEENERAERMIIRRTAELNEKNRELAKTNEKIVELLGNVVEFRDKESGSHVRRVKAFTRYLATRVMNDLPEYHLTTEDVDVITSASALHDIGKIAIPDSILLKPGKLTAEEFDQMKTHCEKGCEMLNYAPDNWNQTFFSYALDICRYHHEKWDGKGYPVGLKEDEIPIAAQIVSIADCYDALTTKRVYKDAYTHEEAFAMIFRGECGAFSDKLLKCLQNCEQQFRSEESSLSESESESSVAFGTRRLAGTRILLVDDNPLSLSVNAETLSLEGADVTTADSGSAAVGLFSSGVAFDVILMDIFMPGQSGIEAIRRIRAAEASKLDRIAIIALNSGTEESARSALDAGADAWMSKPLIIAELTKIMLSLIRKKSLSLEKRLEDTLKIASTDALTHVKNIAAYTDKVADLTEEMKTSDHLEFAAVMCDINHLKWINDTLGHAAGDRYIKNCCSLFCDAFKHSPVYRIGGDEFVAILEGTDYDERKTLLKNLQVNLEKAIKKPSPEEGMASFAYGIAEYDASADYNVSDVVKRADAEMYQNKNDFRK